MKEFTVIMVPPEGHDKTFKDTQVAADGSETVVERPYMRHVTLNATSEDMARRICERQAEGIARQEVGGQFPDDPDAADEAAMGATWRIESIEETGATKAKADKE